LQSPQLGSGHESVHEVHEAGHALEDGVVSPARASAALESAVSVSSNITVRFMMNLQSGRVPKSRAEIPRGDQNRSVGTPTGGARLWGGACGRAIAGAGA
jgi:hypothetical protein